MNQLLVNLWVLFFAGRNAHWNIQGKNFGEMHSFFASIYEKAEDDADLVAERIRQLGQFVDLKLDVFGGVVLSDQDTAIDALLEIHEGLVYQLKELIKVTTTDHATNNMLLNMLQQYELSEWKIRSYKE